MLVMLFTIGIGNVWGVEEYIFEKSGGGSVTGWTFTNGTTANDIDKSSYWLLDAGSTKDYIITSAYDLSSYESATVYANIRNYGSGTNNKLKIEISYNGGTTWAQSYQTSATSGTYTTYSVTLSNTLTNNIKIRLSNTGTSGRGVRVQQFKLKVTYTAETTYNVYLMSGCTGGSYSSNKGTSGSGTGGYSSCTKYSGITAGTSVTITATPSSGYQFDGWTNGGYSIILDDESNEITPSSTTSTTATFTMPSSDVVIWDCNFSETCANTMTINKGTATSCTFSLGTSGSGIASCSGVSTTVTVTPNTGYGTPSVTQSGASKTPTITGSGTSWTVTYPANTTGTSTINVSCSANNYTITLDKDLTPTTAGTASITATYNSNSNLTSAITKPTKTGWTFAGYFTAKNGGGTQIIDASGNVIASVSGYTDASRNWKHAGNITLYAKWTCTVTWSVNGLTNVYSTQTVTYNSSGSKVASVPTPDPASYCGDIFAGWSRKNAGAESKTTSYYDDLFKTVGDSPDIKNIGDITFYAVFANEE